MEWFTVHPGLKRGYHQPYTITYQSQTFFVTVDEGTGVVGWNMFADEDMKLEVEEKLKIYLTNQ